MKRVFSTSRLKERPISSRYRGWRLSSLESGSARDPMAMSVEARADSSLEYSSMGVDRSASENRMYSPVASATPMPTAYPLPRFDPYSRSRICGSASERERTRAAVPSEEPSSTTRSSAVPSHSPTQARTRSRVVPRRASSLNAGITILRRGPSDMKAAYRDRGHSMSTQREPQERDIGVPHGA